MMPKFLPQVGQVFRSGSGRYLEQGSVRSHCSTRLAIPIAGRLAERANVHQSEGAESGRCGTHQPLSARTYAAAHPGHRQKFFHRRTPLRRISRGDVDMPRAFNEQPALRFRRCGVQLFRDIKWNTIVVAAVHEKRWHAELRGLR